MADAGGDVELESFRAEAAAWIKDNFPEGLKRNPGAQMALMMGGAANADAETWRERMGKKGWGVPTWPAAYGGGGLSRAQFVAPDRHHVRLRADEGKLAALDHAREFHAFGEKAVAGVDRVGGRDLGSGGYSGVPHRDPALVKRGVGSRREQGCKRTS